MKKKRLISLLLCLCMLLPTTAGAAEDSQSYENDGIFSDIEYHEEEGMTESNSDLGEIMAMAETATSGDYQYTIDTDNNTATITKYTGEASFLDVPNTIDGYTVTSLGNNAFENCSALRTITIPDSVTSIGRWAFQNCTGLTEFDIPESVTTIGVKAFNGCKAISSVVIPKTLTSYGESTGSAFAGSGLTTVSIEKGATTIPANAFDGCAYLTSVDIPATMTSLGNNAFENCSALRTITIPDSVTSIGRWAFQNCTGLTEFDIPESVTTIGVKAFNGCKAISSVVIPKTLISYGESTGSAFAGSGLTTVSIEKGATTIPANAFDGCAYLTSVDIPATVTSLGNNAFENCSALRTITIPDSVTSIGRWAFQNCTGLTEFDIPESVTTIGVKAFNGCKAISSVVIPKTLTSYGESTGSAFAGSGLTSATIEEGATTIPANAFDGCVYLTNVDIPSTVVSVGNSAFQDCKALRGITLPDSVISIGKWAFQNCDGLMKFDIPESVTTIGIKAFSGCSAILNIIIPKTLTSYGGSTGSAFAGSGLTSAMIEEGATTIPAHAFDGCAYLTDVDIPATVTSIESNAFDDCALLQGVSIPGSVISIGNYAFRNCTALTSFPIPESVIKIGNRAFMGCTNLTPYFYGNAPEASTLIFGERDESFVVYHLADKEGWPAEGELWNEYLTAIFDGDLPQVSGISTTFTADPITLKEGEVFTFSGTVTTTAASGLKAVQVNIHDANDDTVGFCWYRKDDFSGEKSFDLSNDVPSFKAGETVTGKNSGGTEVPLALVPGTAWTIQLFATDKDGNAIEDGVVKRVEIVKKDDPVTPGAMTCSDQGKEIIKNLEGRVLDQNGRHQLYDDDHGTKSAYDYWNRPTIGYGTLLADLGSSTDDAYSGKLSKYNTLLDELSGGKYTSFDQVPNREGAFTISEEAAQSLFDKEIREKENAVNQYCEKHEIVLNQNQFDALVMWFYNMGSNRLENNQDCRLAKVLRGEKGLGNQPIDDDTVKEAFTTWCLMDGNPAEGLVSRHLVEANIYLYGYIGSSVRKEDYAPKTEVQRFYELKRNYINTNSYEGNPSVYLNIQTEQTVPEEKNVVICIPHFDNMAPNEGNIVCLNAQIASTVKKISKVAVHWYNYNNSGNSMEICKTENINSQTYTLSQEIDTSKYGSGIYRVYVVTEDNHLTISSAILVVKKATQSPKEYVIKINNKKFSGTSFTNTDNKKITIQVSGISETANWVQLQVSDNAGGTRKDITGNMSGTTCTFSIKPSDLSEGSHKLSLCSGLNGTLLDSEVLIPDFTIVHYKNEQFDFYYDFHDDDEINNHILEVINETLENKDASKALDDNKFLVFFFEGAGANLSTNKREAAMCIVLKNDSNGNPEVVYTNSYSTTIPDRPRDTSSNDGDPVPIVRDGMYIIKTCNHPCYKAKTDKNGNVITNSDGKTIYENYPYASLKIYKTEMNDLIRFKKESHEFDTKYGVGAETGSNIHAKSVNHIRTSGIPNSSGCFNVGEVDVNDKGNVSGFTEYNKFMSIIVEKMKNEEDTKHIYTFRNISKSANKKWGDINKSTGKECGYVIVDRKLYKNELLAIYDNSKDRAETEEAVKLILREN